MQHTMQGSLGLGAFKNLGNHMSGEESVEALCDNLPLAHEARGSRSKSRPDFVLSYQTKAWELEKNAAQRRKPSPVNAASP